MNPAVMEKVAEDLIALKRQYGDAKIFIPADRDKALGAINRLGYIRKKTFAVDDPAVLEEIQRLANTYRKVIILPNPPESYELYVATYESTSLSASPSSAASSGSRGCLFAFLIIVAVVVVVVVFLISGNQNPTSRQSTAQQGQIVGTMRAVSANQLNMRSGPGQTYSVVRVFTRNERIMTIGDPQNVKGEQWIQASTPDGQTRGWVIRKFLSP